MFSLFHCMFELEVTFGQVRLADAYKSKVLNWLNNNPALLARIYNQVSLVSLLHMLAFLC